MTADPYRASGAARDPQSWNRYRYTLGGPVNYTDRTGRLAEQCDPSDASGSGGDGDGPIFVAGGIGGTSVANTFSPIPNPLCYAPAPVPPPPLSPPAGLFECSIELKYRPVDNNPILGLINHSCTYVTVAAGTYNASFVFEGLPEYDSPRVPPLLWGGLLAYEFPLAGGRVIGNPRR